MPLFFDTAEFRGCKVYLYEWVDTALNDWGFDKDKQLIAVSDKIYKKEFMTLIISNRIKILL